MNIGIVVFLVVGLVGIDSLRTRALPKLPAGASAISQPHWHDEIAAKEGLGVGGKHEQSVAKSIHVLNRDAAKENNPMSHVQYNDAHLTKPLKDSVCNLVKLHTTRAVPIEEQARAVCGSSGKGSDTTSLLATELSNSHVSLKQWFDRQDCPEVVAMIQRNYCGDRREDQLQKDRDRQKTSQANALKAPLATDFSALGAAKPNGTAPEVKLAKVFPGKSTTMKTGAKFGAQNPLKSRIASSLKPVAGAGIQTAGKALPTGGEVSAGASGDLEDAVKKKFEKPKKLGRCAGKTGIGAVICAGKTVAGGVVKGLQKLGF